MMSDFRPERVRACQCQCTGPAPVLNAVLGVSREKTGCIAWESVKY